MPNGGGVRSGPLCAWKHLLAWYMHQAAQMYYPDRSA